MRENLTYGSMRGCWKRSYGDAYTGTKPETADTAKAKPTGHRASALLCALGHARMPVARGGEVDERSRDQQDGVHLELVACPLVSSFIPARVFHGGALLR